MKTKFFFILLVLLMVVSMIMVACSTKTSTATTSPNPSTTSQLSSTQLSSTTTSPAPTQANWWDKFGTPQYGGKITTWVTSSPTAFDPYAYQGGGLWLDTMFDLNWTLDRKTFSFTTDFCPAEYHVGSLVANWDQTDPTTITAHLRQGIHWQNKAPVNGRELVAKDVEISYDRMLGLGGFSAPSPWWGMMTGAFASVTATDKYTVVFKFKKPGFTNFFNLTQLVAVNMIEAPEWIELAGPIPTATAPPATTSAGPPAGGPPAGGSPGPGGPGGAAPAPATGPLNDWHNAVGSGAWMLTGFVSGSSETFSRNPNYWGHDERNPQNQIPYADTLVQLVIPDSSTATAAIRTGKIDLMAGNPGLDWTKASVIKKSNPDLLEWAVPSPGISLDFRNDLAPFTDIRVKNALQMAVNRPLIAQSHYGGSVDPTPAGQISQAFTGYALPFDQWPQDVRDTFTYNPTGAKQLLAEAGYPNGFKTTLIAPSSGDIDLLQILKSEFADIGVDMEIQTMDQATFMSYGQGGKGTWGLAYSNMEEGSTTVPWVALEFVSGLFPNFAYNKDATYDAMCNNFNNATSEAQLQKECQQADLYVLQHNYEVRLFAQNTFYFSQPYLKEYDGEFVSNGMYARWWVDQAMKKSMGF